MGAENELNRRTILAGVLGGAAAAALAACQGTGSDVASSSTTGRPDRTATPTQAPSMTSTPPDSTEATTESSSTPSEPATAAQIRARATVPVLCWHQLREWAASDDDYSRNLLICPPDVFRAQLDALVEDGWSTIGPDDYLAHLTQGAPLPSKPVLLTFDDSQGSQLSEGLPQLLDRGMTATFFIMTVVLGNPGWLTERDLRKLDDRGMTIAAHTWDHHRVDEYAGRDWEIQLEQPRAQLEKIVGKPVEHFAYPYGAWDQEALTQVAKAGYRSAYQLADRTPDPDNPLMTLRRSLVGSTWTGPQLLDHLEELAGPS